MRRKHKAAIAVLLIASLIVTLLMAFGDQYKRLVVASEPDSKPAREIIYWAHGDLDDTDDIPAKDAPKYFGWNRWRGAQEAVKNGTAANEIDFLVKDGEGDLFYSMYHDPALTAAIAFQLDDLGLTGDTPILAPEKDLKVGERVDAAHLRFLRNEDDWDNALARIRAILLGKDVTCEVKKLSNYTSAMYMEPEMIDGDKPGVIVRKTDNAGGHFLVFHIKTAEGKTIDLRLRLECGYQPIDPHWPTPDIDDDPEPHLTPKDPADDPQNNPDAPKYDFYSPDKHNNDPDTTETDEPQSPDTYVAPTQPVTTVTPTPEAETDHGQGDTETHGGQQYTVETGDQNLPPLEDIADEGNPNKPTVEPGLEGLNTGTVTDFE